MSVNDPTLLTGASIAPLDASSVQALGLMNRPTRILSIPTTSVPQGLIGGVGILAGLFIRESAFAASGIAYLTASSALAAAANNVTLPAGGAGVTTYCSGFEITGAGATAGSTIAVTLTGIAGGTATYVITIPVGAGTSINPLIVEFNPPGIQASAPNTAITLNVPSFGAGNLNAAASIHGYQQALGAAASATVTTPTVTADLLDGLDAGGEILLPMDLAPFGVVSLSMGPHGPVFKRGLFLNLTAGTVRGAAWVKM